MKVIPGTTVRHDYTSSFLGAQYYHLKQDEKGDAVMDDIASNCVKNIVWFNSITSPSMKASVKQDIGQNLAILETVLQQCKIADRQNILDKYMPTLQKFATANRSY